MKEEAFKVNQKLVEKYQEYYRYKYISRYYITNGNIIKGYEFIKDYHKKEESIYEDYSQIIMMSIILGDKDQQERLISFAKYRYSINPSEELKYYLSINTDKYQDFMWKLKNNKYQDALKSLENDKSNLGVFYEGIITLLIREEEFEQEYNVLYKKQGDTKLKRIMKYFGQCNIRSNFGE